ncbi:hypothetical protein, partial [Aeromonas sp. HMWF036]|uniref:hypothetical protein n=1 Tax=Aeromonas sp. HMWF036 TaxID=2056869 RepID=UPI0015E813E9
TRHIITAHQQTAEAGVGLNWLGARARPTRHIITAHQQTAEAGVGLSWLGKPAAAQNVRLLTAPARRD